MKTTTQADIYMHLHTHPYICIHINLYTNTNTPQHVEPPNTNVQPQAMKMSKFTKLIRNTKKM